MKRRKFIALIGGAAVTWQLPVHAQQSAMPVVGFLGATTPKLYAHVVTAFRQGLKETGYVEGENVAIEYRWAQDELDRLPALAAELVGLRVAVIAASSTPAAFAAKRATTTIPVVFEVGFDPVEIGLVASLNRPGSNVTGITNSGVEVAAKQLELLHELVPTAARIALLVNPSNPMLTERLLRDTQATATKLGLQLDILNARAERDLDGVFATLSQRRADALVIGADALFIEQARQLAALTIRQAIPASFHIREFVAAGGLMSYGGSITDAHRLTGIYVGRILKGEKPADLPVQQSTKVDLLINLKTAKALGLTVPLPLIGRADEVIE